MIFLQEEFDVSLSEAWIRPYCVLDLVICRIAVKLPYLSSIRLDIFRVWNSYISLARPIYYIFIASPSSIDFLQSSIALPKSAKLHKGVNIHRIYAYRCIQSATTEPY